jgi:hypothetical protein
MINANFPYKIDVPVIDGGAPSISEIFAWCETTFPIRAWSLGGESDQGTTGPALHHIRGPATATIAARKWPPDQRPSLDLHPQAAIGEPPKSE